MVRPTVPVRLLARWFNRAGSSAPEVPAMLQAFPLEIDVDLDRLDARAITELMPVVIIKFGVTRDPIWLKEAYRIAEYVATRPRFHESSTREALYHLANLAFVGQLLDIPLAGALTRAEIVNQIRDWLAAPWVKNPPPTVSRASLKKAADDLETQGV